MESWTINKAESQRIDAFELRYWEKTLESHLDFKIKPVHPIGNQSWIFIERIDAEVEASILWPSVADSWKRPWCWERFKAGGEGDNRGWDGWMASLTRWTWVWATSGSWWWREGRCAASHGVTKSWTWLSDWTELRAIWTWAGYQMLILFARK